MTRSSREILENATQTVENLHGSPIIDPELMGVSPLTQAMLVVHQLQITNKLLAEQVGLLEKIAHDSEQLLNEAYLANGNST
jgi:hypothetical protein